MRQYFLWLVVLLLMLLALTYLASYVVYFASGGSTTYTYNTPSQSPSVAFQAMTWLGYAQIVLYPFALVAMAIYLVLLDREVHERIGRGFEIEPL